MGTAYEAIEYNRAYNETHTPRLIEEALRRNRRRRTNVIDVRLWNVRGFSVPITALTWEDGEAVYHTDDTRHTDGLTQFRLPAVQMYDWRAQITDPLNP